ncbi:MAG: NAD(P)/FAD-dependent oxidoreductase [Synechococcus sp.]|nr:NAD(P)/FAD-dependent oxidoreductase [Synechococcus sp.]
MTAQRKSDTSSLRIGIIGAGPAGLTAAYVLSKAGIHVEVLEADPTYVGGISRTVVYKGYRFDIGGHRFFSKTQQIEDIWREILPDDIITRPRKSRLVYRKKFYSYPLEAAEVLTNLGIWQSTRCLASYAKMKLLSKAGLLTCPNNFEEWVTFHFGWRLYLIFFKTYTEKVWGIPCTNISADWANQRIKGLSLITAATSSIQALLGIKKKQKGTKRIKTLITSFRYPRLGPGMMWEEAKRKVVSNGGSFVNGVKVSSLNCQPETGLWELKANHDSLTFGPYDHVISSAPIREILESISQPLPQEALDAASNLNYRDFILVALILKESVPFEDQWLYIHDPEYKVGRIQNFKNWSQELLDGSGNVCYGMEYFCNQGDDLWSQTDQKLIALATRELSQLGLSAAEEVIDGCVVKQAKAYPVYDDNYQHHLATIKSALALHCPGLHQVGRNGMHKYNNQDHSMMTALLVAQNIINPANNYDPWLVNQDAEYIEEVKGDQAPKNASQPSE